MMKTMIYIAHIRRKHKSSGKGAVYTAPFFVVYQPDPDIQDGRM